MSQFQRHPLLHPLPAALVLEPVVVEEEAAVAVRLAALRQERLPPAEPRLRAELLQRVVRPRAEGEVEEAEAVLVHHQRHPHRRPRFLLSIFV